MNISHGDIKRIISFSILGLLTMMSVINIIFAPPMAKIISTAILCFIILFGFILYGRLEVDYTTSSPESIDFCKFPKVLIIIIDDYNVFSFPSTSTWYDMIDNTTIKFVRKKHRHDLYGFEIGPYELVLQDK